MAFTPGFKKFAGLLVVTALVGGGIYVYKSMPKEQRDQLIAQPQQEDVQQAVQQVEVQQPTQQQQEVQQQPAQQEQPVQPTPAQQDQPAGTDAGLNHLLNSQSAGTQGN